MTHSYLFFIILLSAALFACYAKRKSSKKNNNLYNNASLHDEFHGTMLDSLFKHEYKEIAVVYLLVEREPLMHRMLSKIASKHVTPFIFADRPETNNIYKTKEGVYMVTMASSLPASYGYSEFGTLFYITKRVTSWDKALFFFTHIAVHYRFVWFIESDVYIPSLKAFHHLNKLPLQDPSIDLMISSILHETDLNLWHWKVIKPVLPLPWYHSMACVLGMSRRMMELLSTFIAKHGKLQWVEYLPLTLAMHHNYTIVVPPELETIDFFRVFNCEDILHRPMHWFHPIKDQAHLIGHCIESGQWPIEMIRNRLEQ